MESILGFVAMIPRGRLATRTSGIIGNLGNRVKLDFLTPAATPPYDARADKKSPEITN